MLQCCQAHLNSRALSVHTYIHTHAVTIEHVVYADCTISIISPSHRDGIREHSYPWNQLTRICFIVRARVHNCFCFVLLIFALFCFVVSDLFGADAQLFLIGHSVQLFIDMLTVCTDYYNVSEILT